METRFACRIDAQRVISGQIFTPYCEKILAHERQHAHQHEVRMADEWNGLVHQIDHPERVVNLQNRTCTCREFQKHNLPCSHAIACIYYLRHRLDMFVPIEFLLETWKRTYQFNFKPAVAPIAPPVSTWPSLVDAEISVQAPSGRTVLGKRKRAKAVVGQTSRASGQVKQQGSSCQESGHNNRSCRIRTYK